MIDLKPLAQTVCDIQEVWATPSLEVAPGSGHPAWHLCFFVEGGLLYHVHRLTQSSPAQETRKEGRIHVGPHPRGKGSSHWGGTLSPCLGTLPPHPRSLMPARDHGHRHEGERWQATYSWAQTVSISQDPLKEVCVVSVCSAGLQSQDSARFL